MDPKILMQINEIYRNEVYSEETLSESELADINGWVSQLISEGYNLDDYSDEELYEAYLDEVKGGGKVDFTRPDPSRGMYRSPYEKAVGKQIGIEGKMIKREDNIYKKHKTTPPDHDDEDPRVESPYNQRRSQSTPLRTHQARARASREIATDPKLDKFATRYKNIDKAIKKQYKEELDLYDIVSEYLVSEGFCDSYEDADVIMVNMSEEWRESILESAKDQSDKQIERGVKTTYKAGNVLDNRHQGRSRGLNKIDPRERDSKVERMRARLDSRRDDLFKERNKREDEKMEKIRKLLGL
jgi:hypothetical protein